MTEYIQPPSDDEFDMFLTDAEASTMAADNHEMMQQDCFNQLYNAIDQTKTLVAIPRDETEHDQSFNSLVDSAIHQCEEVVGTDDLSQQQMNAAIIAAQKYWSGELTIINLIADAIARQKYDDTLQGDDRMDIKKQTSALLIAIGANSAKWLPVVNEALIGDPLDPSNEHDRQLIDHKRQAAMDTSGIIALRNFEGELIKLIRRPTDDSDELVAQLSTIDALVTLTYHAIVTKADVPARHARITDALRGSHLSLQHYDAIIAACDAYVTANSL